MNDNKLQHHGIPGMKWGVRRYQNKDGSLTFAGKRRTHKGLKDARRLAEIHAKTEDFTRLLSSGWNGKSQILVPKDVKKSYNRQLDKLIRKSEIFNKKYSNVKSEIIVDKGKSYVRTLISDELTGYDYESTVELREK